VVESARPVSLFKHFGLEAIHDERSDERQDAFLYLVPFGDAAPLPASVLAT
jgi:hypothetical protein